MRSFLAILSLTVALTLGGCMSASSVRETQIAPEPPKLAFEKGAAHINKPVDPNLPHPAYQNCDLGRWDMSAQTDETGGNTFAGSSSQSCQPTASRRGGRNLHTTVAP